MNLTELLLLPRFTPINNLTEDISCLRKLGDRDVFYQGNGVFLGCSSTQFKVENGDRIDYGRSGMYLLNVSAFEEERFAKVIFSLSEAELSFAKIENYEGRIPLPWDAKFGMSCDSFRALIRSIKKPNVFHQEGETRRLGTDRKFHFSYDYVKYDNITHYFFGTPRKGSLRGFTCTLK